ncbi:YggT family protein [Chloroflexota bacterium]
MREHCNINTLTKKIKRIMGRPWWYDSYWEKGKPKRVPPLPRRSLIVWTCIVLLSLLLTIGNGAFHISMIAWFFGFIYHLCRILTFAIFMRAISSWVPVSRYNLLITLLNDVSEPILSPLRRIVPKLAMFDITPMVAIAILYIIPKIIYVVLF